MVDARRAAAKAARDSYGRLLANLAYRWRDIAAAEDALAEAFARALEHWPREGVPNCPDAWLTTVAKGRLLHAARHQRLALDPAVTILLEHDELASDTDIVIADERLRLMFVCAHPSIDVEVRTPLMLQVVLGLEARHIAAAFLMRPSALAQRLVRAKAKIRDSGIRFELPHEHDLPERSGAVLEAVYAAHGLGWHHARGPNDSYQAQGELAGEALFLAELCALHLPSNAEALGLLALLLFCEARRAASASTDGAFVPLHRQDSAAWDKSLIGRAEAVLWEASRLKAPGPFQLEAAIQSAHCQRAVTGTVPWASIEQLYARLIELAPSVGARVGHAVAMAESGHAPAALERLHRIEPGQVSSYQPYWVAKAYLHAHAGALPDATKAYLIAIGLTEHASIRAFLQQQLRELES